MSTAESPLDPVLDELWDGRADLTPDDEDARKIIVAAVDALDAGEARGAGGGGGGGGGGARRGARRGAGQAGDPALVQGAADDRVDRRRLPLPRPGSAEDPVRRRPGR